jgi:hypothetical protein
MEHAYVWPPRKRGGMGKDEGPSRPRVEQTFYPEAMTEDQQPSQQARRAAEAIHKQANAIVLPTGIKDLTQIIERETGVGEACQIIRDFLICGDFGNLPPERGLDQARAYLAKHQPNQP